MKKITVIPEKVVKSREKVEILCDLCGKEVEGYWWMSSNYNGVNYEYTSPIDLCEHHQHYYERALRLLPFPFEYMKKRYDNEVKQEKVDELLKLVIDLYEDDY